jgi:hypothetical protein
MPYVFRLRRAEPRARVIPAKVVTPPVASLKKDDLVALAESKDVDTSGTKAEIIARLEGDGDG